MNRCVAKQFFLILLCCCWIWAPTASGSTVLSEFANKDANKDTSTLAPGNRITRANTEPHNWLSNGRTYDEQRYSPLAQINADNVSELGLAWSYDLGTKRGLEATPLVVDGVMYTTGTWSVVYAFDARTGRLLWQYDPKVDKQWAFHACCDVVNRGVAYWEGKVYVGSLDGRLIAIDAQSGQPVWETLTIDKSWPYTITGAPRVVKGKVIIGNGGADMGVRGYVSAFDAETGKQSWRFYTVPGNPADGFENEAMEKAAATWTGSWWTMGGGGTVWDSLAYDPELDLLYVGIGNGGPWNIHIRSPEGGDNLYVSSIVALKPDTGEYVWHYQETPGDRWDYTATQHMVLADLEIQGQMRKVLMQAPKNGFFYVLDRRNGELISAEPYVTVTWASHVDLKTGRPVETDLTDYSQESQYVKPSMAGGHNWHPSAYSPDTGLFYIPALEQGFDYKVDQDYAFRRSTGINTGVNVGGDEWISGLLVDVALESMHMGYLIAWDPVAQREAWRVSHNRSWNAGVLVTAGDVLFQATTDGRMVAYRAGDGVKLWEYPTYIATQAAPMTYSIDGEQYIAVMAGWGGATGMVSKPKMAQVTQSKGSLFVWKLSGQGQGPSAIDNTPVMPLDLPDPIDESAIEEGVKLYSIHCARCHGIPSRGHGVVPDLAFSSAQVFSEFEAIVLGGIYWHKGMVSFHKLLAIDEVRAIKAYILKRAKERREEMLSPKWWVSVKVGFFNLLMSLASME